MNDVQQRIEALQANGWTIAALASEIGVTVNAVQKWKAGTRYPTNSKAILLLMDKLAASKAPKKRRYAPGSRIKRGKTAENVGTNG